MDPGPEAAHAGDDDLPTGRAELERLVKAYADAVLNRDKRCQIETRKAMAELAVTDDEMRAAIETVYREMAQRPPPKPSSGSQKKPARTPLDDPNQPDLF